MSDLRLPEKNSATDNSWRVGLKALPGFVVGLIVAIWSVPGVTDAMVAYFTNNLGQLVLSFGLPLLSSGVVTGAINFVLDQKKKGMQDY